ncbi:MAG TPA: peptide-methionine (S)-S-oxide reductase [Rhizobiales bacterium]|nr:peptide-methionine (S)-S-oxide reductase [Hyphomicrobiales bacterium]
MEKAIFGAGCFWGVEAAFAALPGVIKAISGYCGGETQNPSYEEVCTGTTRHAEVVEVTFDPDLVSYEALLDKFWSCHNPTQVNRQGPDIGSQYRSVIFTTSAAQHEAAIASRDALEKSGRFHEPVATVIESAATFWPAEDYHQRYFEKRGIAPNCHL